MTESLIALEVDCSTGQTTERPLTNEELIQRQADAEAFIALQSAREAEEAAQAEAKASAEAKLTAIGLTPEEIAALTK